MYSAVTLAGALGTKCIILAGARGDAFPAAELECLKVAASGGYVVGGKSAVPDSKLAGRTMTRIAGNDRWATAEAVGTEVQRVLDTLSAAARQQNAGIPAAGGGRGCGTSPAGGTALSASEILAKVGPSMPVVEGCLTAGSGILIDGGFVLTGYQVIGLCETATVTFPDGTEHEDVPVTVRDSDSDYALLGPIRTMKNALTLHDGEELPRGSRLYRVGHDFSDTRQPVIDAGRLARVRTWDTTGATLLQTDAALGAISSSGDALVDDRGRVVGIFTATWGSTDHGLAFSTEFHASVVPLLMGDDPGVDPGWRTYVSSHGRTVWDFDLTAGVSQKTFVVDDSWNGDVEIRLRNCPGGTVWAADWLEALNAPGDRGADFVGSALPTFATVHRRGAGSASCRLEGNVDLYEYVEHWNGEELPGGLPYDGEAGLGGLFDHFTDSDLIAVRLSQGDTLRVWADSATADTALAMYDEVGELVAEDDNSGPPDIFNNAVNPEIAYRVPTSGIYTIEIWQLSSDPQRDASASSTLGASSWRLSLERTR